MFDRNEAAASEKLLFILHDKLDAASRAGGAVPPGASAILGRALDEMRLAELPSEHVRRAETVSIALHRLEWTAPDDKAEADRALAAVRDEVRLLLIAPGNVPLETATTSATLFDWDAPHVPDMLQLPTVWMSRLRQHRMVALA